MEPTDNRTSLELTHFVPGSERRPDKAPAPGSHERADLLRRLCITLAIGLAIGWAAFPILWYSVGYEYAARWWQGSPVFSVFVAFVLPLGMATFAAAIDVDVLTRLGQAMRVLVLVAFGILLVSAVYGVLAGCLKQPVAPIYLNQSRGRAASALAAESALRAMIDTSAERPCKQPATAKSAQCIEYQSERARYQMLTRPFDSIGGLVERAGPFGWLNILTSTIGAILSACMMGYAFALMALPNRMRPSQLARDRLLMSYGLLVLFIPFRLLSTWYENHILSDNWLPDLPFFIMAGAVAAISFALVLITVSEKRTSAVFSVISIVTTFVASGLARWNEKAFVAGASAISALSPRFLFYFFVMLLVLTLVFLIIRVFGLNDVGAEPAGVVG